MEDNSKPQTMTQFEPKAKNIEVATLIATILTFGLVINSVFQLHRNTDSMKADFAHKIKIDFFNDEERMIMFLLNNNMLEFKTFKDSISKTSYAYFSLNERKVGYFQNDSIDLLGKAKKSYTTLEIEDLLLNHFEDLNMYRVNKVIGLDYLENGFATYIFLTYNNPQIQKLIKWLNDEFGETESYKGFKDLNDFIIKYEAKTKMKESIKK
jgi:hypothetical protein